LNDIKLGIFGDSTADPVEWLNHSWVELLAKEYKFTNFAKQGSSLLYTYNNICIEHHQFDKIIVFIPPVGRLWAPNCLINQHFLNHRTVELYYENADYSDRKILDSIKNYFIYVSTFEKEILQHNAIVDSIKCKIPNALIIPVTKHSIENFEGVCMHDISIIDYEFYNVHPYTPDFGRTCHMNKENNQIFYQKIKQWLDSNDFILSIDDFTTPVETKEELFPNEKY
jgi:hypothetical protein